MLWRRYSNVVATSLQRRRGTLLQRRKRTSAQISFSTVPKRYGNVNNDVVTTLSQRRCASWVVLTLVLKKKRLNTPNIIYFYILYVWGSVDYY